MTEENKAVRTIHHVLKSEPLLVEKLGNTLFNQLIDKSSLLGNQLNITRTDCIRYLQSRVNNQYIPSLSVIYDNLADIFPTVQFAEIYTALGITEAEIIDDIVYLGDVDYLSYVGEKAFGIQIKPTTAKANFGNYSVSERMKNSFAAFQDDFSGKVFIVFSLDGEIGNPEIIQEIAAEIAQLQT